MPQRRPVRHPVLAAPPAIDALRVLSIHHRTAALDDLERMVLPATTVADLGRRFGARGLQAVVLSTCHRTELYSCALRAADHARAEEMLLATAPGGAPARERFMVARGRSAAEHLFRVAAGLESLVLGEAEVLGQVRIAIRVAEDAGAAGSFLSALFRAALRFAGRARSETAIGTGALSVASASIRLLGRVHPDVTACTVLVVGAGATGLKAARQLAAERVGHLVIANRTASHAAVAAELGGEAVPVESLPEWLARADAVIAAVQVDRPLITAEAVGAARAGIARPIVLVDLSLPRAIEPECASVPGVTLHDLSGLEPIVAHNRARRESEIPRVAELLERELEWFTAQTQESMARPLVAELRRRAEAIRREELERAARDGVHDRELLDRVTRRLVARLLHVPSTALRRGDLRAGAHGHDLRSLFGLHANDDPDAVEGRP